MRAAVTYRIEAAACGVVLTDNYGTKYGKYATEAEAAALITAWTGEPWETKAEPKHEFDSRMYGAPAADLPNDQNDQNEPD